MHKIIHIFSLSYLSPTCKDSCTHPLQLCALTFKEKNQLIWRLTNFSAAMQHIGMTGDLRVQMWDWHSWEYNKTFRDTHKKIHFVLSKVIYDTKLVHQSVRYVPNSSKTWRPRSDSPYISRGSNSNSLLIDVKNAGHVEHAGLNALEEGEKNYMSIQY